VKLDNKAAE
jgi:tRNA(His) guanylyltransferase